jgi:uncharacterized Zn finger protein (UPF0148 family)
MTRVWIPKARKCPECGGPLVYGEGCLACPVCGYTACFHRPRTVARRAWNAAARRPFRQRAA